MEENIKVREKEIIRTSFDVDKSEAIATLHRDIQSAYPDYHVMIVGDIDV